MDLLIQAAGWALLLLSIAVGYRKQPEPKLDHELTLIAAMDAEVRSIEARKEIRRG